MTAAASKEHLLSLRSWEPEDDEAVLRHSTTDSEGHCKVDHKKQAETADKAAARGSA